MQVLAMVSGLVLEPVLATEALGLVPGLVPEWALEWVQALVLEWALASPATARNKLPRTH